MHKVFVYGSLKRGNKRNEGVLSGQKYCGVASIQGAWTFVSFKVFPAIVLPRPGTTIPLRRIKGEVYEVDDRTLRELDRVEGTPSFYQRIKVTIKFHGDVFIYVLPYDKASFGTPIAGDSWSPEKEDHRPYPAPPSPAQVTRPANLPEMQWLCHVPLSDGTVAEMQVAAVTAWDAMGVAKKRALSAGMEASGVGVTARPVGNNIQRPVAVWVPKPYVAPKAYSHKFLDDADVCSTPTRLNGTMNGGW